MIEKLKASIRTFRIRHKLHKQGAMASAAYANWKRMSLEYEQLQAAANVAKIESDEAHAMYAQARNRELIYSKVLDRVSANRNERFESA